MITIDHTNDVRIIGSGMLFPEGPVEMADGSVCVVELRGGVVRKIKRDGSSEVVVATGGCPNGMAWGPGGLLYICNNGGSKYSENSFKSGGAGPDYVGGFIQTLNPETGELKTLYRDCDGYRLSSPNDLVFDRSGGFYFSDMGKRFDRHRDYGAIYYAKADGTDIKEIARPVQTPNGVGLNANETILYFSETETGRLWAFDIEAPGVVKKLAFPSPHGARLVAGMQDFTRYDSLAVDEAGNICIGTLSNGSITVISPTGEVLRQHLLPDPYVTNICFGGENRQKAYITLAATGRLAELDWPVPGQKLNFSPI